MVERPECDAFERRGVGAGVGVDHHETLKECLRLGGRHADAKPGFACGGICGGDPTLRARPGYDCDGLFSRYAGIGPTYPVGRQIGKID